ncbi:MAG: hypothetical protein ABSH34_28915 [Verrucomicrobiota bacterium]
MRRRRIATLLAALIAPGLLLTGHGGAGEPRDYSQAKWQLDSRCVLPRGSQGEIDSAIAGDPCIVWDADVNTWRMFYFASSGRGCCAGQALAKSAEAVGPGDWKKTGKVEVSNPDDLIARDGWHKWWVVMDPWALNHAAKIDGKFWWEPAPSQGGWARCDSADPSRGWKLDTGFSPLKAVSGLSEIERAAGIEVNLWRHHLLITPSRQARIFFNSGRYGHEQMFSAIPE